MPTRGIAAPGDLPENPPAWRGPVSDSFNLIAILSAFNEGDIIFAVIEHLVENDIQVYLIDDSSTDDTVEQAGRWLGRGLLKIETFRAPRPRAGDSDRKYHWFEILRRKEQLATELNADWFMHHDADEIREGPWPGLNLKDAVRWVDRLGYNAIDFKVLNFPPVDDGFRPGTDPRTYFRFWEESASFDRTQIKCWKSTAAAISMAPFGGHEVRFEGRRVFPIQFLLRHYPIRGQSHGAKKIFGERKGRFLEAERARGWHVQYDDILSPSHSFLRDPSTLHPFDLDQARLEAMSPASIVRDFEFKLARRDEETVNLTLERNAATVHAANLQRERDELKRHAANLVREEDAFRQHAANLEVEREALRQHALNLERERDAQREHALNLAREEEELKQHAANLEVEREALRQHALNLARERAELQHHAANLETERTALQQLASNLSGERDTLASRVATLRVELDGWSRQAKILEEAREALQLRTTSQALELDELKLHASRLNQARDALETRALELEWQRQDLDLELRLTRMMHGAREDVGANLTNELAGFKRLLYQSELRGEHLQIEREKNRERAMLAAGVTPVEASSGVSSPTHAILATLPELGPAIGPPLDVAVSVIIPTFNAGGEFYWLLEKLRSQRGIRSLQIVTVDSGSSDGTDVVAAEHGCKVIRIDKEHFSHSFSRNLGADHANGDLLLFMVQDAYPIGDYWLYGLVSGLLSPASEEQRVSALSCAEFPRTDSEVLYDCLVGTHYEFLGCNNSDRIGRLTGLDNISLRTQGQLSDVACLIPRTLFDKYRYYGRYAEDLLLGVRLIRDGHRLGMVSSIKVIHSHNRPVGYYVRRVFVDVMFLTEVFADFSVPAVRSVVAVLASAFALAETIRRIPGQTRTSLSEEIGRVIDELRQLELPRAVPVLAGRGNFGFPPLGDWIERMVQRTDGEPGRPFDADEAHDLVQMRTAFVDRLDHLRRFVERVYASLDDTLAAELNDAVEKTLAMTVGAMLAFYFLHHTSMRGADTDGTIVELKSLMLAGI